MRARLTAAVAILVVLGLGLGLAWWKTRDADVIIGRPPARVRRPFVGPSIPQAPPSTAAASTGIPVPDGRPLGSLGEPASQAGMRQPDGHPYGPAVTFTSDEAVPDHLVFVLVAGVDARPGERLDRTRSDSIHLLAINPATGAGTVLGFPRDTWVEIPRHGRHKINDAMAIGGPDLLSETVQVLTGLPVQWWVLTGFDGLTHMVDALGGLDIEVTRRMADRNSGAFFERGYHHMAGHNVLAFSRDRHSVAQGDFSRSQNQGAVLLAALRKMRVDVGDMGDARRWVNVLVRYARLDASMSDTVRLAAIARRLDPDRIRNVVAPGTVGTAGRASVVYLTKDAAALFADLRADATIGGTTTPSTTTTTSPPATAPSSTTTTSSTTLLPPVTRP